MVILTNTNIVVDSFVQKNLHPLKKYVFFLTHMHAGFI